LDPLAQAVKRIPGQPSWLLGRPLLKKYLLAPRSPHAIDGYAAMQKFLTDLLLPFSRLRLPIPISGVFLLRLNCYRAAVESGRKAWFHQN
jgi:hypothetical protein